MEKGEQLLLSLNETAGLIEDANQLVLFAEEDAIYSPCQCQPGQPCSCGHTRQECDQDCCLGV